MAQRRRVEYAPGTPLGQVLDALAAYQRHHERGELAAAAAAARTAELTLRRLTDAALAAATDASSARQVAPEVGLPPSSITYRIRRHRNEEDQDQ